MVPSNTKNTFILFLFIINLFTVTLELRDLRVIEEENEKEKKTIIKPPGFSRISGFYSENFKLKLSSEDETTIYYTTDSSDPRTSSTSKEFKDYILIYDKSLEPNIYSNIKEDDDSPVSISRGNRYTGPVYPVDKAMIVRAVTKNSKGEFSEVNSRTYFVTTDDLAQYQDLTVISIVTNPENLFDPDTGIYVTGTMYQEWKKSDEYDPNENLWDKNGKCNYFMRGEQWEREASVTIFDKGEKIVQQNLGIRIKGSSSRNNPGKSFNLFAHKKYGNAIIEAKLLDDNYDIKRNLITKYKSISLRCIYEQGRLKDKFGRDLFYSRKSLTTGNMRPIILFLNGEYWGLYIMQEKLDNNFIESNYLIPSENVAIVKEAEIEEGPKEEWEQLKNFFDEYSKKDLADEKVYEDIKNYIDINSMIEFFATGIYISIGTWPAQNEVEWRNMGDKIEGNRYSDGKWRFMIYDLDYTMGTQFHGVGLYDSDNFKFVESKSDKFPSNLFIGLLKNNTDFRNKFINIYCDYANEIYKSERVNELIEKYRNEYLEIVAYSQLRWWGWDSKLEGYSNYKQRYLTALNSLSEFFEKRAQYTLQHMQDFLQLENNLVNLTIEIKGNGKIIVNSISPKFNNGKWSGNYFTRIPILLWAIPGEGYEFKGWSGSVEYSQQIIEIQLKEKSSIIAVFE